MRPLAWRPSSTPLTTRSSARRSRASSPPGTGRPSGCSANSAKEAIGQSIRLIIPPDRVDEERQLLARVQSGEVVEHFETVRRRKDGLAGEHFADCVAAAGPAGPRHRRLQDRARHRRAATPGRVQARLAAIIDSSDDAIISKTLEGIITSWNRAAERMFGYEAHEAVGQAIFFIIPGERRAEEEMVLGRIRAGEIVDHFETVRRRKTAR